MFSVTMHHSSELGAKFHVLGKSSHEFTMVFESLAFGDSNLVNS